MITICPLFSGSEGNSIYIEDDDLCFLVDAGRSAKQIESTLMKNDLKTSIKFILVTHEHSDHTSGLRVFAKKFGVKIYASKGTIKALEKKQVLNSKLEYKAIDLKGIENEKIKISPFEISHDCSEGYGYSIFLKKSNVKISICSDLGYVSQNVLDMILGSNVLFIESNHDLDMLKNGPYPQVLKDRIMSKQGHLSNSSCSEILPKLVESGTSKFILCHLSSTNNTPEIAYNCAISSLKNYGMKQGKNFELYISPKKNVEEFKICI